MSRSFVSMSKKKAKEIIDLGVITSQTPVRLSPTLTAEFVRVLSQALEVLEKKPPAIKKSKGK